MENDSCIYLYVYHLNLERNEFMKVLEVQELKQITGGGFTLSLGTLIGIGVTFLIGFFDGYVRPLACH